MLLAPYTTFARNNKALPLPNYIEGQITSIETIETDSIRVQLYIKDANDNTYYVPTSDIEVYKNRLIPISSKKTFVRLERKKNTNIYRVVEKAVISNDEAAPPCYIFQSDRKIVSYIDIK